MLLKFFQKNRIKVFYALNDAYVDLCAVSIKSILNHTKSKVDFYVMYNDLSVINRDILSSITKINFVKVDNKELESFKICNKEKIVTWYKILMPKYFKNIRKAIFLHADTMFLDDIKKLWDTDISNKMIACVCDVWNFEANIKKFNLNTKTYFNDGVILVNFDKWRKENLTEKIKYYLDQGTYNVIEVLNILTSEDKIDLSPKYNYMETWWYNYYIQYKDELLAEYNDIKTHPIIVHFTGQKPKYPLNTHSFKEQWWNFASEIKNYQSILEDFQSDVENNLDKYENILKSQTKNS